MGTTPRRVTHKHSLFTGVVSERQRCSSQSRAQSHFKTLRVGCTTDPRTTAENPVLGRAPEGAIAIYTRTTEQFTLVVPYTKVKKKKKYPAKKQPRSVFLFSLINLFIPGMVGEIMRLSSLLVLRSFSSCRMPHLGLLTSKLKANPEMDIEICETMTVSKI